MATDDKTERVVRLEGESEGLNKKLDRVLYLLEGNGTPGIIVRVDRLEQPAEADRWIRRVFIGAVVVAIAGMAMQFLTGFERIKQGGIRNESTTSGTGTR